MEFSAKQIAAILGGTIEGNPEIKVSTVCKIEEGKPGAITFLANPAYTEFIYKTEASIAIVSNSFKAEKSLPITLTLIKTSDAYQAFATLLNFYNSAKNNKEGIEQPSFIDTTASVGEKVYIGAFAYIGKNVKVGAGSKIYPHVYIGDNTEIGENAQIFSGVKIYHECKIGNHVTIHAGSIIGADGFGFAPNADNQYNKVPQIGNVIVEDYVEIGANTTVDRATIGSTVIKKGVKLDNLVQIAHNVEIGENTVVAAQSGIAGSTKIGKNAMFGGQVGILGHLKIADGAKVAAQSGVGHHMQENEIVQGSPAFKHSDYKRSFVLFRTLPKIKEQLDDLKKEVNQLKAK
ncbi:MAG: UDP-3-O-(3-hydroxymyristoyl)glucosamine N-acyltransferase [Luteibaculaceae bacterium]